MIVLQNIVWLLVLIGVMILVHELGHFWAARYFDVKVEAFSFGFGPRLFGFRWGETDYRFSAILFGGYVKMAGEQPGDENFNDPRGFLAKPRWQRLIIAAAGPFMNIVLAVSLLTGLYMVKYQRIAEADLKPVIGYVTADSPAAKAGLQAGDLIIQMDDQKGPNWEDIALKEMTSAAKPLKIVVQRGNEHVETTVVPVLNERTGVGSAGWAERGEVQLGTITPGMPAEKAGLKKGDIIAAVNGQPIHSATRFHEVIRSSKGKPVEIMLKRDGEQKMLTVHPVLSNMDGGAERWMIGVLPAQKFNIETTQLSFPDALQESVRQNLKGATLIFQFLEGIIERRMSARSLEGPIRIAQLSGEYAREGPSAFVMFMSMVSLNLAILNLLPIPILDGGVIVLLLIEMLMRRDLSMTVREAVFKVGFVFIMVMLAFVLYNDITKVLPAG